MEWFRWFPTLYADDTLHLSLEQDAIYRRLIDWYMLGRMPLPCSDIALARICQISLEKWQEHAPIIVKFFTKIDDKYRLKRCDVELDRQDLTARRLGDAAKKAHEARKNNKQKQDDISQGNAEAIALPTIEERRGRGEVEDKERKQEKKEAKNAKPKFGDVPADWRPNEQHLAKARSANLDCNWQADKFRNYCSSKGKQYANHDAAFHNWLSNAVEFAKRDNPPKPIRQQARGDWDA